MKHLILISFVAFLWSCGGKKSDILIEKKDTILAEYTFDQKNKKIIIKSLETQINIKKNDTIHINQILFYSSDSLVESYNDTVKPKFNNYIIINHLDSTKNTFFHIINNEGNSFNWGYSSLFYWDKNKNSIHRIFKTSEYTNKMAFNIYNFDTNQYLFSSFKINNNNYSDSIHYQYNGNEWIITPITPKGKVYRTETIKD